jgi:hypothetical protein
LGSSIAKLELSRRKTDIFEAPESLEKKTKVHPKL